MANEIYKLPLVLTPERDGAYTVTSPMLPELITAGATAEEALRNVRDALAAVIELYEDLSRALPDAVRYSGRETIEFDYLLAG